MQSLWQTEITCQGKGTWGEGNTDHCTITFIQWRVSTPAPLKSVNIKEIWHYPLNCESLSQALSRPDCFFLQKESWWKPQLVSKKRNRNLRKHLSVLVAMAVEGSTFVGPISRRLGPFSSLAGSSSLYSSPHYHFHPPKLTKALRGKQMLSLGKECYSETSSLSGNNCINNVKAHWWMSGAPRGIIRVEVSGHSASDFLGLGLLKSGFFLSKLFLCLCWVQKWNLEDRL